MGFLSGLIGGIFGGGGGETTVTQTNTQAQNVTVNPEIDVAVNVDTTPIAAALSERDAQISGLIKQYNDTAAATLQLTAARLIAEHPELIDPAAATEKQNEMSLVKLSTIAGLGVSLFALSTYMRGKR